MGGYQRSAAQLALSGDNSRRFGFKKGHPIVGPGFQKGNPFGRQYGFKKGHLFGTEHGLYNYPEYSSWGCMMARCYNPKHQAYARYGGIGIVVWEPSKDPRVFVFGIRALLGEQPRDYSIDRINPHGGYYPWNVRWADRSTQSRNRRKNVPDYLSQSGEH